ncbi:hypothetical protein L1049_025914 [Liquidambar formosana]|uniref:non-specific serine/threonine protein kinase n=1 Tax=Liquidambar formosana TaxID=63359 RepID=A0AAP0NEI9_LIQFO
MHNIHLCQKLSPTSDQDCPFAVRQCNHLPLFSSGFFSFSSSTSISPHFPFLSCLPTMSPLFGGASFKNNSISLTEEELTCLTSPPSPPPSGVGRALYVYPIRFLDFATNATASFSCRFSFSIIPSSLCPFGDGIAFLITSNAGSFSHSDGYMGLPEPDLDVQDSFIAVEFDTNFDPELGDINGNHIGIDVNTVISFASVDAVSKGIDLKSGRQITAWIEYRDAAKMIWVWVGYSPIRPSTPLLVAQIDLSKQFKEFMHVGFSASNGQGSASHIVDRWRFKTFGSFSAIPLDTAEGGDCLMCSPEDSSMNINPHKRKTKIGLALGLGGLAAFLVSVIAFLVIICLCMIKKTRPNDRRRSRECQIGRNQKYRVPERLSLAEIRSATEEFNQNRIIGEGASATVYKGSLSSGGAVAVKRFTQTDQIDSFSNPFTNEFGTMVGCLRHRNLVQLQGWCSEGNELVLVYEYLPNGSLDKILHKDSNLVSFLTWERRVNIVLGVASALTYLHEECERQIIHRDVKTCNIMLDAEFNANARRFWSSRSL